MKPIDCPTFLALLSNVANEVLEESGSPQRFNDQGKPLRRTKVVDPEYHAKLTATSRKTSDERAKRSVSGFFATT